jgi:hypothetical protein
MVILASSDTNLGERDVGVLDAQLLKVRRDFDARGAPVCASAVAAMGM